MKQTSSIWLINLYFYFYKYIYIYRYNTTIISSPTEASRTAIVPSSTRNDLSTSKVKSTCPKNNNKTHL